MHDGQGQPFFGPGGPGFEHAHHHPHPFAWLLLLVLLALIVVGAVWLVRRFAGSGPAMQGPAVAPVTDGALETVRLRYARGEIDRDEFLRVSADLGGTPLPAT